MTIYLWLPIVLTAFNDPIFHQLYMWSFVKVIKMFEIQSKAV